MKKVFLLLAFLVFAPLTLTLGIFVLMALPLGKEGEVLSASDSPISQLYAALPAEAATVESIIEPGEARSEIIRQYLEAHQSPMLPYADTLFEMSEKYQLDYRLMVAIAQCESNLCKKSPPGSFNCWGFENGATHFLSWEQAIEQVAKTLKERYIDMGLTTPEEIMPKYAPPSVEIGGPWAKCVSQFLEELE
ncbi:hypothetical protein ACFL0Y_01235 [Patescibacteria group bacterium]